MNLQELTDLVRSGESERLEFKRTTDQRTEAMRTVCAMLNGLGGFVLFGVNDRGQLVGQTVSTHTLEEIANEVRRIEPPAFPDVETVVLANGNTVVALRVPGGGGPYTYEGRPYLRNGPTTISMPQQRYGRLLLERLHAAQRWENQPAEGITVTDLDHAEILRTIEEAIRRQRMDDPNRHPLFRPEREIRDGALGLRAPIGRGGNLDGAEAVTFGAGVGHRVGSCCGKHQRVLLNLFQHPPCHRSGGACCGVDPETSSG